MDSANRLRVARWSLWAIFILWVVVFVFWNVVVMARRLAPDVPAVMETYGIRTLILLFLNGLFFALFGLHGLIFRREYSSLLPDQSVRGLPGWFLSGVRTAMGPEEPARMQRLLSVTFVILGAGIIVMTLIVLIWLPGARRLLSP